MISSTATKKLSPLQLPPLTRNDYLRSLEVEEQIREALSLSRSLLARRAEIRDYNAPDFFQEETLAFLIRHYRVSGNDGRLNDLSVALIERITGRVKRWLRSVGLVEGTATFDDAFNDVVAGLYAGVRPEGRGEPSGGLLDLKSDKADYAQVCFWKFLDGRIGDVLRRAKATRERSFRQVEIDDIAGHGTGDEEEGTHKPISDWAELAPDLSPDEYALKAFDEPAVVAAIERLPNRPRPLRDVVRLWYLDGWQIDSNDPKIITISSHYVKTPRTIQNWMREAEGLLATILRIK